MRKIISRNPFTGRIHKQFDFISNSELDNKIKIANQALKIQAKLNLPEKAQKLENLASIMEKNLNHYAQIISTQVGKPIVQARGQVSKSINHCRFYAKNLQTYLNPSIVKTDAKKKTLVKYLPLGIIYVIIPFNNPFWINFRGLPHLLLGNSLLTRNSDSTPLVGEAIEDLMKKAGFDSGQYQNVYTSHDQIDQIFSHDSVCGVSFTGSSLTGGKIAQKAGKYIKKSVLELGGNDPYIVLEDADIQLAAKDAVRARCANAGQICFSPKRFIIVGNAYEKFKNRLIELLKLSVYGDPLNQKTTIGPLARPDIQQILEKHLENLPSTWKVIFRYNIQSPFYPITVYQADYKNPYNQELFGPVYSLFHAKDQAHAIEIANQGNYGLAGSVYTQSNRGEQIMQKVRCGMAFVNQVVKSDSMIPSGGVGRSGYGRQCGIEGFRQFANIKLFYVN